MKPNIISNPVIDRLPAHLHQYIKPQHYEQYTPVNQAVWRYVMRRNVAYLSKVAHDSYLQGLKQTGISIDQIPNMYGMNRILREIGWAAVAVDGFIPPAAFMEFQAYNVLVIASDIRKLENIAYTPAPDIIHEAAGHAPIIANREYAEYLRRFGEIGSKAIASAHDWDIYEAVRLLSQLKEQEGVASSVIEAAEEKVDELQNRISTPSEMARIRNLHWWTVEYGLIGTPTNCRIYGAGLLSSIGESQWCMSDQVKKERYSLAAADQSFDITKPQPQLYVTPDFAHLSLVLEEFANTMALRKGGLLGVRQLIESQSLGTIELSTGLQISGVFTKVIASESGKVAFIQASGPAALAYHETELIGHGTDQHIDGFGSPLGRLKGINLAIEDMSPRDLEAYNIYEGRTVTLDFEGDVQLQGQVVTGTRNLKGKIILVAFRNCLVSHRGEVIFEPGRGIYHLAVGKEVVAAFAGPADCNSFDLVTHELSTTEKIIDKTPQRQRLESAYQQVRNWRDGKKSPGETAEDFLRLQETYSEEWLLQLELLEWAQRHGDKASIDKIRHRLLTLRQQTPDIAALIDGGLELIFNNQSNAAASTN